MSKTLDPPNVKVELDQRHRDAMLDVVLAWGSLDGALGALLATVRGMPLEEGAEEFGKLPSSSKIEAIRKIIRANPNGLEAARFFKKLKKELERNAFIRNRITHSHCAGILENDPDFVVFATFEKVADSQLAVDMIPIEEMQRVSNWGRAMAALAMRLSGVTE